VDCTNCIGLEFDNWRFNLHKSNTEPVIRLNIESGGDIALVEKNGGIASDVKITINRIAISYDELSRHDI
jgi:phosphomannomutase